MSRSITIEDLYAIKFLSRPRISPDGRRVAFVVTTIDESKHEYRSSIWVASTEGGEAKRFVGGIDNAHSPAWSPDGRWLAFVSDREGEPADKDKQAQNVVTPLAGVREETLAGARLEGKGKAQIWLIPTDGGEAHQLTFMPHGAAQAVWAPDSQRLIFSAAVGPLDEETEDGKPLPKARVIDRLYYRLDGVGFIYERRQHLFLIDVGGGAPTPLATQQLTDGDWDDKDAAWSPDGTRIVFASSRAEDRWRQPCPDVYTLSIQDGQAGELQCLTDGTLSCSSPSWSPDGKTIAFFATTKLRSAAQFELFIIDAGKPQGLIRNLTSEFEGSCTDRTNSDMTDELLRPPPVWSPDGKVLYVQAMHRGATRVFAISREGAGKQPPTLTPGNVHVMDSSSDASAKTLAMLIEAPTHVGEIFVCSTAPRRGGGRADVGLGGLPRPRRITHFNDALFDQLELAIPDYMPYTGADGWPMDGWILKPPGFDPTQKYPLIVEIHGGPNTQYGYGFLHEMQVLTAAGYVVLYTNPRGSQGYGQDFALAVRGAWAQKDSLDIMAGVDTLLQKGYIDEQRLGVTGGSYGGFMTNWLIGHTDRFRAAVTDRSVVDRFSFFGSSDIGWDFTDDDMETTPWDDLDRYMRMSPITYVKNMRTPLLIIHSENDLRCNIEQGEQLFAALKYLGREVLFVRFEGQSHGLSRGGHPRLRLERLRHILGWFEKYL